MAWELASGVATGTTGSDGNPTFTVAGIISNETVAVDRILQFEGIDYTKSANILTFLAPSIPVIGAVVRVNYTGLSATAAASTSSLDYSSGGLLSLIRDVTYVGASARDWDDAKILRLINRMIGEYLVPFIASARKNHFDTYSDQTLVASQSAYYLPSAAVGMKARAVQIVDSSGSAYAELQERELEDGITEAAATGLPQIYWFQGNKIVLYPAPSGSPTGLKLRIHYLNRPSMLVGTASAIQITGFPGGAPASNYRVSYTGTAPTGFSASAAIDLVQGVPGFDIPQTTTLTAVNVGSLDILGTQPSNITIGDWVCVSGQAPVVTGAIPEMVIGCLVRVCQLEILSTKSDEASFERAAKMLGMAEKRAHQFLNRRNTGDRPKFGILSSMRFKRSPRWSAW